MVIETKGLRKILKQFENASMYGTWRSGNWRISNGGYDLWFQLYYCEEPVVDCIAGTLEGGYSLKGKELKRVYKIIQEIFPDLDVEEVEENYEVI